MLEKKKLLIDFLKERSIGFLKAQKVEAEARMEAAMRPKGVLLNYKNFKR